MIPEPLDPGPLTPSALLRYDQWVAVHFREPLFAQSSLTSAVRVYGPDNLQLTAIAVDLVSNRALLGYKGPNHGKVIFAPGTYAYIVWIGAEDHPFYLAYKDKMVLPATWDKHVDAHHRILDLLALNRLVYADPTSYIGGAGLRGLHNQAAAQIRDNDDLVSDLRKQLIKAAK